MSRSDWSGIVDIILSVIFVLWLYLSDPGLFMGFEVTPGWVSLMSSDKETCNEARIRLNASNTLWGLTDRVGVCVPAGVMLEPLASFYESVIPVP